MKKVLIILPSFTSANGIANVIMNFSDKLINEGYFIDYMVISNKNINEKYLSIIEKNNSKVFIMPNHNKFNRYFKVNKYCEEIFKQYQYDIVHVNLIDIYAIAILKAAKSVNITSRIYHVHNPNSGKNIIHKMIKSFFNHISKKNANIFFSCSELAAKSMLKKEKFEVIKNGIETNIYQFNEENRENIRKIFKITDNTILIGTVGRLEKQKNPEFALKIIYELIKNNSNIKYLWVGNGSLKKKIKDKIKKMGIEDKVIFAGDVDNVQDYYSAFDVFLLPSKFEGLGIVFIEAQANGLDIFTSTNVPKDIEITKLVNKIELSKKPSHWAKEIEKKITQIEKNKRYNNCYDIIKNGFDKNNTKEGSLIFHYNKIRSN